ncbi:MAG: tripartite tricarboxylate transporter substrate binding protein [Proteobacteria bacterium]|nr:tripartite tricarboxylate transporter substrate binding protein [Pseudomonadota bacterium]
MNFRMIALAALFATGAHAAEFPERPVQIIAPYAAGGGLDTITRTLAQRLSTLWGQQVIVENRPGAGATIGTQAAVKAKPDGYTLLVGSTPLGIAPVVYPNLAYDARRDLLPVSLIGTTPEVLVATPGLGVGTAAELVAAAKKDGRKLNFGSAGSGTLAHLAAAAFNQRLGLGGTHVPYKGSNPALVDLIGGQIDWLFDTPSAVLQHARSGKVRALAIAAPQRSAQMPTVPTLAEAGFPDMDFRIWMALLAPAGTPEPVMNRLQAGIAEIMKDPALRASLTTQGWDIVGSTAKEFATFLDIELPKLAAAARAAGVKAD